MGKTGAVNGMAAGVRPWGGEEASHSCTEALLYFPPMKSKPRLLVEEQALRVQGGPTGSLSKAGLAIQL